MPSIKRHAKIYVAGHQGLVGSALLRRLRARGYDNLVVRTRAELDLTRQEPVEAFFAAERPEIVFLAAAKVGGIGANSAFPAEFIHDNLAIALNVVHAAWKSGGCRRLLNLGSSCIYPRLAPQPIREEHLLTGPLEPTNEAYAIAKIAALKLCAHYRHQYGVEFFSAMPTNLYGPGDNYHPENSHVLPALIRKFHEARLSGRPPVLWGDGSPRREFLHADDLAEALLFLMELDDLSGVGDLINVGSGEEVSIRDLAALVAAAVGYTGAVSWDASKPNGTPRKLMDSSRLAALGWRPRIRLCDGLANAYQDFLAREAGRPPQ